MPTTSHRNYPYPAYADPARVPTDMKDALDMVDSDVQGVIDAAGSKVTGLNVNTLWVGTQEEYEQLVIDPNTVYVISDASATPPDQVQALGTPVTTSLGTTGASSIVPNLPTLTGHWGYLAIIVGQSPIANGSWTAPAGWFKLTDQSVTDGGFTSRTMAVFSAPAGTSTAAFASPAGGSQRYVAAVYPVLKQPVLRGMAAAENTGVDAMVGPAMVYAAPALTVTVGTTNYGSVDGSNLPVMTLAQVNAGSGQAVVSGSGNVTMMHVHAGSGLAMASASQGYSVNEVMDNAMHGWRFGIGHT